MTDNDSHSSPYQPAGWHYLLELFGCSHSKTDDHSFVLNSLQKAANEARATVVDIVSHRFSPSGVTAVALLKESHLSIHCWPEAGYVAVDLFSCGDKGDPQAACDFLAAEFESTHRELKKIRRGDSGK